MKFFYLITFIQLANCLKSGNKPILTNYQPAEIIKKYSTASKNSFGDIWTINDLQDNIDKHNIDSASLIEQNNNINGIIAIDKHYDNLILPDNLHYIPTKVPQLSNLIVETLQNNNINFDVYSIIDNVNLITGFLSNLFPIILIYVILSSVFSRFQMGNPVNMINKKQELINAEMVNVSFADVAGCDESKYELQEVVDFLKDPDKFKNAGAKIPKGILLEGPPGTGKTLLARAVAGESGVSFISVSGSQFIEMFVGVGAARVRSLFEMANANKPCVIFIDEIDAIGRQRGTGFNSGNDEREQTLNQILTNMDGFDKSEGIIVLGATNRADILDSALLRAGRFDRKVLVGLPDSDGRKAILNIHLRNKKYDESVDFDEIALLSGGFSGAELENLANEAAILSLRYNLTKINKKCMLDAYEKITIGLPSKSQTKNNDVRELVAYHEAGHATMAKLFNDFYDVRKITINANKGGAGGYTLFTPKEQYESYPTKKYMLANLIVALGGRAAEIILFTKKHNLNSLNYDDDKLFKKYDNLDITTGASGDLKQADTIARQYINLFGLNNNLGVIDTTYGNQPFLGRELANGGSKLSEYSKSKIDREVASLIQFALNAAVDIIENNIDEFTDLAKLLLEKNTIDKRDLEKFNILY
jgi:cell division protease FtsH